MAQISEIIAEYTSLLPATRRERINALHEFITARYPQAQLSMKYKMPTYGVGGGWVSIANQKNYVSFYTCAREHIQVYIAAHPGIKCGTGCINFRDSDEIQWADLEAVLDSALGKFNKETGNVLQ